MDKYTGWKVAIRRDVRVISVSTATSRTSGEGGIRTRGEV
jgi:hypothetical protein